MDTISSEQIRRFRLYTHHLDTWYAKADTEAAVGACGFQNSPPGAWESALYCRVSGLGPDEAKQLLEGDKTLLQAWSFRGAPVVFPTAEGDAFLSALLPRGEEPWIYTRGIQLALDFLGMRIDEVLPLLIQAAPGLNGEVLKGKTALDQTLAEWVLPLLPQGKRALWNAPSMYGASQKQTVGGAVVSFLLRPCSFLGLVVFGEREGSSPTFTSHRSWTGRALEATGCPEQKLVRKYLRCFGPATVGGLAEWLGCSRGQAERMWRTVADEIEPVAVYGKARHILSGDKKLLADPPQPHRNAHLLAGHDPYLGLQDRSLILENPKSRRLIWQTVSNPGAVLCRGEIVGMWRPEKKGALLELKVELWDSGAVSARELQELSEEFAYRRRLRLHRVSLLS